jgi:uncharacterized protein (TIGR02145 family)
MCKTVEIGGVTWLAENLNIQTANSWCYDKSSENCAKYGRLYIWEAAKSACLSVGWRLPTRADWDALVSAAGGDVAGKKLKSKNGWIDNGNGTDDYGFSALPGGGRRSTTAHFDNAGYIGLWWTASDDDTNGAYSRIITRDNDIVYEDSLYKNSAFSVRCLKD